MAITLQGKYQELLTPPDFIGHEFGSNMFTFAYAAPTEIGNRKSGATALIGNVSLPGPYTFAGASPTELSYLSGVTSIIQTQRIINKSQGLMQPLLISVLSS